ncbi:37S ribosomal protein S22 [Escovopsis weberi]|uniref:37S ribosomal protein S22 n=1 Tax=Escovopsis weberi TaxID=150374 RepID=A0A0M9VVQ8_ESCWE|nr:37S ribosomal protein S22 [Escovopsis weberi]
MGHPTPTDGDTDTDIDIDRVLRQDGAGEVAKPTEQEIEKVVRDAKQRFRDTLPTGYLNEEEYALYVRLYGPPLRETAPEDVGIPTHVDMDVPPPAQPDNHGTVLRELDDGEVEEIAFTKPRLMDGEAESGQQEPEALAAATSTGDLAAITKQSLRYIDAVARNDRERDALQKLMLDFEAAQKRQHEHELAAAEAEDAQALEEEKRNMAIELERLQEDETLLLEEKLEDDDLDEDVQGVHRFHPLTLAGKFSADSVQMLLPKDEFAEPIRRLLGRSHLKHVKAAAEEAFGGKGLPLSPASSARKVGHMGGVRLPPDQRNFTEIEADAFLASYLPPAYASAASALREVRRRLGSRWLQSRLNQGSGLSVLDAGAGGAGLVAWEEILQAEWALMKERGEVTQKSAPGRKTVVAASDRLRERLKTFLHDTTFLPRLPDYEHSGEMHGEHLDAGHTPQPRKSYDLIIASHLFLKEDVPHHRQAVLNNLWTLLNKDGGVLVVIEKAHPRGFEAVAHVRDTILRQFLLPQPGSTEARLARDDFNPAFEREREPGHVVAPCSTQGPCPMYRKPGKSQGRKDYCHFVQRYFRPGFHTSMFEDAELNQGKVEYSYVAIRRGRPTPHDSSVQGEEQSATRAFRGYVDGGEVPSMQGLPRVILPPLKRKGHVTLDVCTPAGEIERWTVPKSFGKQAYHDARKARWGDIWALGAKSRTPRQVRLGSGVKPDSKTKHSEKKKGRRAAPAEASMAPEEGKLNRADKKRSKKQDKRLGLIQEILDAESFIEKEMEEEMDLEDDLEGELERSRRSKRGM